MENEELKMIQQSVLDLLPKPRPLVPAHLRLRGSKGSGMSHQQKSYYQRKVTWKDHWGVFRGRLYFCGLTHLGGPGECGATITHAPPAWQCLIGERTLLSESDILSIR
jgi:hypothetical protein